MRGTSRQLLLSTAAFMGTLIGYGRGAYAATNCTYAGLLGNTALYTCSGAYNAPETITRNNTTSLAVSVPDGDYFRNGTPGSLVTPNALVITGYGAVSFIDPNAASYLYAERDGLRITSRGDTAGATPGSVYVNTAATIYSRTREGLEARNDGSGSIEVKASGNFTGYDSGIAARHYGNGSASITATGVVTSTNGFGVRGYTGANTTGLTINAAEVMGDLRGIDGRHNGGGALQITATGAVTGTDEFGIHGYSGTASTGQTITADKTVTGYLAAIVGTHEGSGVLSITAKGDTLATGSGGPYQGIAAYTGIASSGLTINAVNAEGTEGIRAYHSGTGALQITATGTVTGREALGILAAALDTQAGAMTINANEVTGELVGIHADHYYGTGVLSVTATGAVTGNILHGIIAAGGRDTEGVTVNAAAVTGGDEAIQAELQGSGALSVTTTGAVDGVSFGVHATNEGTGATKITTKAAVTATNGEGISAFGDTNTTGMTIHAGATTGGNKGINADHLGTGALEIIATGAVTGTNEFGIKAYSAQGTGLTIRADKTVTGYRAIYAMHQGTGALTITARGNATGTVLQGIFAYTGYDSSSLTIHAAGATGSEGIHADHAGSGPLSIVTNGAVVGDSLGILALNFGSGSTNITVNAGSSVTSTGAGQNDFAIESSLAPTNLTVAGALNGGGGGAVLFDQGQMLDDRVALHPTAQVTGNVLAGPGTDTLAFGGSGKGAFNLNKIDTGANKKQFQSFETFRLESGTWNFSGATPVAFTQTGGTLNGNPTFGGLNVLGGKLAPGNSIGTVTVNGAFSMAAASTFEVELNAAGQNDKVIVHGTVNLTGATLKVLADGGAYADSTDYVLIDNDGTDSVKGTFGSVFSNLAFLVPTVDYAGGTGNDVVLTLERNATLFQDVAKTKNQKAVAGALDRFPTDNPLFLAVLNQTVSGARQAFNTLSGEIHATVAGTLVDDSRYAREAVLGRMMQAGHQGEALGNGGPQVATYDAGAMRLGSKLISEEMAAAPSREPLAFWTQGYGAWGTFDGDGNAATADRNLGGFISGMDASVWNGWRVGVATGASFSDVTVDDRYSGANTKTYHLGGYVNGAVEGLALRGGGIWAWSEIETSRAVLFPGFYERQKADYDADTGQLFGEIAYPAQVAGIDLEPFAGLAFVSVDTGGFKEKGGPEASLRSRGFDQDVGYTTVGLRAAKTMLWGAMEVTPHLEAAWLHALDDVTPGASLAFATTGIGFAIDGVPLAEDSALLDAGVDLALTDRLSAGVSYQGQYADNLEDNAVKGRFTWLFN